MLVVDVKNLSLTIDHQEVLKDVSVHIESGQIYALLGPNGAGKSSTIAALLGLYPIDKGQVVLFGEQAFQSSDQSLLAKIGVMPENAGFYEWMSAPTYLNWYAQLYTFELGELEVVDLLQKVGLGGVGTKPISQFSRGMKQRLALARALVNQPKLLILDEPTNGLDPKGRREIHDLLLALAHQEQVSILLCTHLLDDVDRFCDKVGIIQAGQTVLESPLSELMTQQVTRQKYKIRLANLEQFWQKKQLGQLMVMPEVKRAIPQGDWVHFELQPECVAESFWKTLMLMDIELLEIRSEDNDLEEIYLNITNSSESSPLLLQEEMA